MKIPLNPYVAGNPVGDSPAFVGRADVLREVLRVLRRSQDNAIVLYGQRRIGKTSILQHLKALLPREGPYRPVYFDLQDKAAWPLGRVLQDLARTIAHVLGHPDPDLSPDSETTFHQEWLPAILGGLPDGSSLVLLLDEFDVLAAPQAEQAAAAFFPYLRGLLASDPRRLQFIFVIGRNVTDLDHIALSLFKGAPARRVSLLSQKDSADLVRLSEANDTLRWPDEAVERVRQWTCGHPFLTQQLCSHVWERAYDEEPDEPPTVTPKDVDKAVPKALEASRNSMEWLWDGLPPAERVVASALAEAGPEPITQEELERLLRESGIRVIIRELQNAPQLLQGWDLIEPADGGYRFRVELLRRWIIEHKPLHRVQEELDRIEPTADNFFKAGKGLYRSGQLEQAIGPLRQAIELNPNHVGANQLLAEILLAQEQPSEAVRLLERLYKYHPAVARPRLLQALLAQAQTAESDDEQLALYERVLVIEPEQPEAKAKADEIRIKQDKRRRDLDDQLQKLVALEGEQKREDALILARKLADEFPSIKTYSNLLQPQLETEKQARQEAEVAASKARQRVRRMTAWGTLSSIVAIGLLIALALVGGAFKKPSRIAFHSVRPGGTYEIYVVNADGSEQSRLTNNSANDLSPAWSPDGKQIAFTYDRDNNREIYLMDANGSNRTRLTNNSAGEEDPVWSPNGRQIAFASNRDGNWEIYVMNADGSEQTRLTDNSAVDYSPAWSPDGKQIAFYSNRDGNDEIYVMNTDGSHQNNLTNSPEGGDRYPAWSPNGKQIVFTSNRNGNDEIYLMNIDGSEQTRLTSNSARDWDPVWSPDGKQIAFASESDGNSEIYVMNADGSGRTNLTHSTEWDGYPAWRL